MSDFSKFHRADNELLHNLMYQLHDDIYFKGVKRIKKALITLHKLEVENEDIRGQCRGYIIQFEAIRDQLDAIGNAATNLRTKLIRENGCDGSCCE